MKVENKHFLFILIMSFVLYGNTLMHEYALDDVMLIKENKFTKQGLSGIPDILTNDSFVGYFGEDKNLLPGGRYRPMSQVTFAIEYHLFGLNPFIGHLVNIVLYFLLGVFILKLLQKVMAGSSKKWYLSLPFIIATLYIAHPIHTEAVANVKGRDEIMGFLGSIAALFYSLEYIDKSKLKYLIYAFLWFALGVFSKESAITFIAIVPLTIYFFRKTELKGYFLTLLPLLLGGLLYFVMRYNALGFLFFNGVESKELLNNPFLEASSTERYATVLYTMGKYIELLLLPISLTHDYYPKQIPIISFIDIRAILPVILYFFLIVIGVKGMNKKSLFAYGILFYLVTFSIVSNLIINIGSFMNERFVFGPSLGFLLSVIVTLYAIFAKKSNSRFFLVLMVIILLGFSFKTISRNRAWKNDYTLFTIDAKTSINSAKVNVSAGGKTIEKAEKEHDAVRKNMLLNEAKMFIVKGLEIHPKYAAGWLLLGNAQLKLNDYSNAMLSYEKSLKLKSNYEPAINNLKLLAQLTEKDQLFKASEEVYSKLIAFDSENSADYLYKTAIIWQKRNNIDSAIAILKQVVSLDSEYEMAYDRLGEYYGKYKQDFSSAIKYLQKGTEINPDNSSILINLGIASALVGNYELSISTLEKALKLDSENKSIYMNLATTYYKMGHKKKADELMAKAEQ